MDVRLSRVTSGLVAGLITAGAIGAVLGFLDAYQVPDHADQDFSIGLAGALSGTAVAAVVVAVLSRAFLSWSRRHVVVPLVLVPLAVMPLVSGLERNRLEAALIWGTAAVAVHLWLVSNRWTAAGLVLPCVVAGVVTVGLQSRWRAQKFEAVGLPLYVPEVPGYRLTGTWAGRYSVSMALRGPAGEQLYGVIASSNFADEACEVQGPRQDGPQRAIFCLRGGAELALSGAGVAALVPAVTVRKVDGSVLAGYPDDSTMSEPD